jgi:hypothetical protein
MFPIHSKRSWGKIRDFIPHRLRVTNQNPDIQFTPNMYNEALVLIEDICLAIANKTLVQLGLPAPNRSANNIFDRDLRNEKNWHSKVCKNYQLVTCKISLQSDRFMNA